ncbi:dihydrodipicolinate synthase family protein [Mesorhizobium sp. J428]|uniref:dihydrodipicolinate synthase family protein n=1 Tax=Mesorhizobium sp. J428 TaxID=2898440 RepID=UPI00215157F5|nr:dihydrodipicolinate synthase family protein [Mesorhizobium sp. J428]MCR5857487.1 dihydrodipicolinate synthase family protein [Mesorhizobium sp. J428]
MALLDETAKGVFIIAVTPFGNDGTLDLESADRMTDFYLERGAAGLTVLGIMGEAPKLTAEESRLFVRRVIARAAGRVPVVVGVSAPGLAPMRELAHDVMADGAAGVMVAPISSLRTDEQCYAYFEGVAQALGPNVPFVLQDYPLTTGVQLAPQVIQRVIDSLPSCVMLKHEDWPGLAKITALRKASDGGKRRISILTGNGGLFLPEEFSRGADGAMTGFAFPEMMVGVWNAHAAGDTARAHDLFDAYLPFARYEQQQGIGLAVRKYVLAARGAIKSAALRAPGPKLSPLDIADIELLLKRQEARLKELG